MTTLPLGNPTVFRAAAGIDERKDLARAAAEEIKLQARRARLREIHAVAELDAIGNAGEIDLARHRAAGARQCAGRRGVNHRPSPGAIEINFAG